MSEAISLLEGSVSEAGLLAFVLICLVFELGIVTKGRVIDARNAAAEADRRADAAEDRLETERKENTEVMVRIASKMAEMEGEMKASREETRKLQTTVTTAIKTQNTLMKQMSAVLVRAGIEPPPREENPWGS